MSNEREVILRVDEKNFFAKTSFTMEDIDSVVEQIRDRFEDMQDNDVLIRELQKNGYISISGPAPELLEIW